MKLCLIILSLLVAFELLHTGGTAAQVARLGSSVRANSFLPERQSHPRISAMEDGGFVVVWDGPQDADLGRRGIFARRFASSGAAMGDEFLINTTSANDDYNEVNPVVTGLSDGGFVVVWEGPYGQDGDSEGIFGQIVSASDGKVGTEFRVNTKTTYSQWQPDIAALSDGGFVVAWFDSGLLGFDRLGPMAKTYDSAGAVITPDFALSEFTIGLPTAPEVSATENGGFIAVWASLERDGDDDAVVAARYSSSGSALTAETVVNSYTIGTQAPGAVARLADGRFVVVWNSIGQDGNGIGVVARRLDSAGSPLESEILVNSDTVGNQVVRSVAADPFGGFVVTWGSYGDGASGYDVLARHFATDGGASPAFGVPDVDAQNQVFGSVESLLNGHFVIAWESQTDTVSDVFFQRYCLQWVSVPTCGKASCMEPGGVDGGSVTATDASAILETSIALRDCSNCVCDANNSSDITATDALLVLQRAVGQSISLTCPPCT